MLFQFQLGQLQILLCGAQLSLQPLHLTLERFDGLQALGALAVGTLECGAVFVSQSHHAARNFAHVQVLAQLGRDNDGHVLFIEHPFPRNQLVVRVDLAGVGVRVVQVHADCLPIAQLIHHNHLCGAALLKGVGYLHGLRFNGHVGDAIHGRAQQAHALL